jgi:hypothetical protein
VRFVWLLWLKDHFGTFGYSHGLLRGAIGTLAVLVTAATIWAVLHHRRPAVAKIAAGVTCAAGIGWLAVH